MYKEAFLFINGEAPRIFPEAKKDTLIICTDGAYNYLKFSPLKIDVVIGDLDSIHLEDSILAKDIIHIEDQNTTDFEKALQYLVDKNILEVKVYGATGKDQDHFLGNLSAGLYYKDKLKITFISDNSYFYFLEYENTIKVDKGSLVSLFPFPIAKGISTEGLQYPLKSEDLVMGERIGIRNTSVQNSIIINFKSGNLILFVYPK